MSTTVETLYRIQQYPPRGSLPGGPSSAAGGRRHFSRLYRDPLTGSKRWGLVRAPDGRILGIHSLSTSPTLRRSGFPVGLEAFAQAQRHDEWVFALQPVPAGATASVAVARH